MEEKMIPNSFDIDRNLICTGSGQLTHAIRYVGQVNLANLIIKSIEVFQSIDREYKKSLENDGKILGVERVYINQRVDLLLNIMILIWQQLCLPSTNCNLRIENKEHGFILDFNIGKLSWKVAGNLTPSMNRPHKNFSEIYTQKLAPEVMGLLRVYKESCKDNVIDDNEREHLKKGLKQVIYFIIYLRFQIEKCYIDK